MAMPLPQGRVTGAPTDALGAAPQIQPMGPDISALLGGAQPPPDAMTPNMNDMRAAFMQSIRDLTAMSQNLAAQYPAFAPFAEAITKAAQEGLMSVVSQMAMQTQSVNPMAIA